MKKAVEKGALALNYVKATKFIYDRDRRVIGAKVQDLLTKKEYEIYAEKIVNATGPWVEEVLALDYSRYAKKLHLTKGIHLVFDQGVFPLRQAIYFDTPDGRMVFAIPGMARRMWGPRKPCLQKIKPIPK